MRRGLIYSGFILIVVCGAAFFYVFRGTEAPPKPAQRTIPGKPLTPGQLTAFQSGQKMLETHFGKTQQEIVTLLGPPAKQESDSKGRTVLTYDSHPKLAKGPAGLIFTDGRVQGVHCNGSRVMRNR